MFNPFKEPIVLVGGCGSGKTHLVRYLSQQSNQELMCYQLSEETDAQSLIGGYVQAEDGSFQWRPGPLADAATRGGFFDDFSLSRTNSNGTYRYEK